MESLQKIEARVLEASSEPEAAEMVQELFSEPEVAAVSIPKLFDAFAIDQMVRELGGLELSANFQSLARILANQVGSDYQTSSAGLFIHSHPWHLAVSNFDYSLRVWVHLRDNVRLWLSRARSFEVRPGFDLGEDYVTENSLAPPIQLEPSPGTAILFVDRGLDGKTGTSTFHKTDVLPPKQDRMSIACDIVFTS